MHYVLVGINHKNALVAAGEHVALNEAQTREALLRLKNYTAIDEVVILSTSDRTELYVATESPRHAELALCEFLKEQFEPSRNVSQYLYRSHDRDAIAHLFNVAASLDVKLKSAYQLSLEQQTTGVLLKSLFETVLFVGARVRTETEIERTKTIEQANKFVDRERDVFYETLNFQIKRQSLGEYHGRESAHQKIS